MIPFNKPYVHGKELLNIKDALESRKICGDGHFTKKCHEFFEERYGFNKALLTTSCTDALEMAAILLDIKLGDEVIVPSYTFVSSANAFALRGAKIVFADSCFDNPNVNPDQIRKLITARTKAIVVVHYAGVACDMAEIMAISNEYGLPVVEDAAQAIDSYYQGRPLGTIGTFGAFSFHETKNIVSGEGGLLVINDDKYIKRAEIIREKGTNRASFFRGEVDKYGWVDIGSSFLPSDILAAYLYGQLENIDEIQNRRKSIWLKYYNSLSEILTGTNIGLPKIESYATNNGHMFYLTCFDKEQRSRLIDYLKKNQIQSVFHYISLHSSSYFKNQYKGVDLPNADKFSETIVRLPLYVELGNDDIIFICKVIEKFICDEK
ncbi:dTDP-4-amino-4,6-dideoxygalactose transaminase [Vibrio diabolicus]|uniref:dTDP-4-amino-4,6-dideoxygalactose transaminase n=1 Tax=Vibrio diabolicus TaxID=50719 RepID=UPI002150B859|nr:dTDP-4-amino-4,6-dideoxygalactose transaminase [Vibrio diabolicus]